MSEKIIKYAILGAWSRCFYNVDPDKNADGATEISENSITASVKLYDTVTGAIDAIRRTPASHGFSLEVVRVVITEKAPKLTVVAEPQDGDKFVLKERNNFFTTQPGYLKTVTNLEAATIFDTKADVVRLFAMARYLVGATSPEVLAVREVPGGMKYTVEPLS